uniref:Partial AB-hydrolase lipase domain-containing protein n=1 Tax=Physcomitrium patens TaxID=3218 RepID=A0A7I4ED24_PHYPA
MNRNMSQVGTMIVCHLRLLVQQPLICPESAASVDTVHIVRFGKDFFELSFGLSASEASPHLTPRGSRESHGYGLSYGRTISSGSLSRMYRGMKDYMMPKQTGDRRKGVIEDMQFWVEIFIERIFEIVRSFIYYSLSPFKTAKLFLKFLLFSDSNPEPDDLVETSTLGDSNPALQKQTLNTDGRTCEDVITSLGYPYEALRVTTDDGYILLLERIPRPNSQKVLYLQHGILDSSLGWVSNGVVGSQAFAAYDQGYDVFLGNFRGLASREHVDPNISARRYWQYSVNEHGTLDITAMLAKIHEIKMVDLRDIINDVSLSNPANCKGEQLPYSLCGVAHSLGGAAVMMYVITRRLENKPHYLSRLILLSPAGFHEDAPLFCWIMKYAMPVIAPIVGPIVPGLYIPTRFFRGLFNKLVRDFQNYPAVGGLVQTLLSSVVGGDSSNWVGAIGMTHYNMNDMPGLSFIVGQHLAQMMRKKKFTMFDFGSAEANLEAYGTREPLDIGAHYGVIDIPVDVVAGTKDKLIPPSMVNRHYQTLKKAGCKASYDEFDYAHLDFTFSHKEELQAYVMSRLLLVTPPLLKSGELKKHLSSKMRSSVSRKSLRKPRIVVEADKVSKEEEIGSTSNASDTDAIVDAPPYALTSTAQTDLERVPNHDKETLSSVTAGSIATESHEESVCEPQSFVPQSFDDSSLFAFPSTEVVSIMLRRIPSGASRNIDVTRTNKFNVHQDFDTSDGCTATSSNLHISKKA